MWAGGWHGCLADVLCGVWRGHSFWGILLKHLSECCCHCQRRKTGGGEGGVELQENLSSVSAV
jgi:hypothetical protein